MEILVIGYKKLVEESGFGVMIRQHGATTLSACVADNALIGTRLWDVVIITRTDNWKELFKKALCVGKIVYVIGDGSCAGCLYDNSLIFHSDEDFLRNSAREASREIPREISHEV